MINALKRLFSGLKRGGDMAEETFDLSRIDTAVSPIMSSAARDWWEIFMGRGLYEPSHKNFKPLPVGYISSAYLSQLITSEIKFELADEKLNFFVQKNLLPNLDKIMQLALVGGYAVIKPYLTRNDTIFFDIGTSRDFLPIELDENGRITEGIFFERVKYKGRIYERREHHTFSGGVHSVKNTALLYGTNHVIDMSEIPRWSGLLPQGQIPSDIPMIATLRTPYANNIDPDSPLPVSLFANSVGTLHEIDAAHSEYRAEFKKLSAKVFADETVITHGVGIPDDYFVRFSGDGTSTVEQQIMTYAPPIRETELKAAVNTELRLYEVQIGVSAGTFSFDSQKGLVTATQVLSEDRTTYNTVAQIQRQLRTSLENIARITSNLARFYGIECEDGEPAIEFGDSVFEDTGTEFNRRLQLVQAGLLKPEEFNAWYFGVPLDKAREMLPEMTQVFEGEK